MDELVEECESHASDCTALDTPRLRRRRQRSSIYSNTVLASFAPDLRRQIAYAPEWTRGWVDGRASSARSEGRDAAPAKPTSSYRHHVTRHGDAGNVIGLRGLQVSRELRRDIDLSVGDVRTRQVSVSGFNLFLAQQTNFTTQ